jgi:hypothetical protein
MAKKTILKQQRLRIETMGLTVYCETEFGQYRDVCEAIDKFDYDDYAKWAEDGTKWGHQKLGKSDEKGVVYIAMLPKAGDGQSLVQFCAGLALSTVICTNVNVSVPLVSRLAGVIFSNLKFDEIEVEDEPKTEEGKA